MADMWGIQEDWRGGMLIDNNGFHKEVFFHMVFRKKSSEDLWDQRKNQIEFRNHTSVSLLLCHSNIFVSSYVYILHRVQHDKFSYNNDVYRIRAGHIVDHNFGRGLLDHTAYSIPSFHRNNAFPGLKQGSQDKVLDGTTEYRSEDMRSPLSVFHIFRRSSGGVNKDQMGVHLHIFHRNMTQSGVLSVVFGSEDMPT
jgi:hypothetical protein